MAETTRLKITNYIKEVITKKIALEKKISTESSNVRHFYYTELCNLHPNDFDLINSKNIMECNEFATKIRNRQIDAFADLLVIRSDSDVEKHLAEHTIPFVKNEFDYILKELDTYKKLVKDNIEDYKKILDCTEPFIELKIENAKQILEKNNRILSMLDFEKRSLLIIEERLELLKLECRSLVL